MTSIAMPTVPLPEAARRLRIAWSRAWDLLLTGELTGEKIGARWYVTEESVAELLGQPVATGDGATRRAS